MLLSWVEKPAQTVLYTRPIEPQSICLDEVAPPHVHTVVRQTAEAYKACALCGSSENALHSSYQRSFGPIPFDAAEYSSVGVREALQRLAAPAISFPVQSLLSWMNKAQVAVNQCSDENDGNG